MLQIHVLNAGRFFHLVNGCQGPVRLFVPGQAPVELRGNGLLQNLLLSQSNPLCLRVQTDNGGDTARLIRFMQEDGREKAC